MAAGIPARLTVAQGRRFGLSVGAAFAAFAAFAYWRGHLNTAAGLGAVGGLLALAGILLPARLGPVERAWMQLAYGISKVTTPIVMGAMYLLVLTPFGLLRRFFGGNPLVHRSGNAGFWKQRSAGQGRSDLTRQF